MQLVCLAVAVVLLLILREQEDSNKNMISKLKGIGIVIKFDDINANIDH